MDDPIKLKLPDLKSFAEIDTKTVVSPYDKTFSYENIDQVNIFIMKAPVTNCQYWKGEVVFKKSPGIYGRHETRIFLLNEFNECVKAIQEIIKAIPS